MLVRSLVISALAAGSALLAGCSDTSSMFGNNSANLTTASVAPVAAAPKADPACTALTAQIDSLRKEGVPEKIEKASLKKYKMTTADLAKADQLNKSNTDFQTKCTTYKPSVASAAVPAAAAPAAPAKAASAAKEVAVAKEAVASAAPAKQ